MLDKLILVGILAIIILGTMFLWIIFDILRTMESRLDEFSIFMISRKNRELNAEKLLAQEYEPETSEEASLYLNKDGKYSYLAYNENKKKRDKLKNPDDYIDDFEKIAVEEEAKPERKSKYAR